MTGGKHLNIELNTLDEFTWLILLLKCGQSLFGLIDILEHSLNLADDVVTTLNLKLSNDILLSFIVYGGLVQESICEQLRIGDNKLISSIQAAEKFDHLIDLLLDILLSHFLEGRLLRVIGK